MDICSFDLCDKRVHALGLCGGHYTQKTRNKPLTPLKPAKRKYLPTDKCEFSGCENVPASRGLCKGHVSQVDRGTPLRPLMKKVRQICAFETCEKLVHSKSLCAGHRSQLDRNVELRPLSTRPRIRPVGDTRLTAQGYVQEKQPTHPNAQASGWIMQHIKVMSDYLERALYPNERVHHKNGIRDDNRIENLELWATDHPYGQRVSDLIPYWESMLSRYSSDRSRL